MIFERITSRQQFLPIKGRFRELIYDYVCKSEEVETPEVIMQYTELQLHNPDFFIYTIRKCLDAEIGGLFIGRYQRNLENTKFTYDILYFPNSPDATELIRKTFEIGENTGAEILVFITSRNYKAFEKLLKRANIDVVKRSMLYLKKNTGGKIPCHGKQQHYRQ